MYYAMVSWKEGYRQYQRAIRTSPFSTLEKAISYAVKKGGKGAFVCQGVKVIWTA